MSGKDTSLSSLASAIVFVAIFLAILLIVIVVASGASGESSSSGLLGLIVVLAALNLALGLGIHRRLHQTIGEEEHYRAIVDTVQDGIWSIDVHGRLTYANPQLAAMLGYDLADLLHTTIFDHVAESEHSQAQQHLDELRQGEAGSFDFLLKRKDGAAFWTHIATRPLLNSDGEVTGALGMVTGISERKIAEEAFQLSERRMHVLLEAMPDMILTSNREGQVLFLKSAVDFSPYRPDEEIIGRRFQEVLPPDVSAEGLRHVQTVFETGQQAVHQYQLQEASGPREYESRIIPCSENEVMLIVRDITEQNRTARERLQRALEHERLIVLSHFIQHISHDLRTPLTIMASSMYLLKRKLPEAEREPIAQQIDNITAQITHLERQLHNLFAVSRLMEGRTDLNFVTLQINDLVQQIIDEQQPLAAGRQQSLVFSPNDTLPTVVGDAEELERVIRDLVANALNYTSEGGEIIVSTRSTTEHVVVEVRDNGIGISPIDIPFLFDPFFRVDEARSLNTGGLGLGLCIADMIARIHSGVIRVESVPDEGSTFSLLLPAVRQ
jgi:PAS domain S-box-containing protein